MVDLPTSSLANHALSPLTAAAWICVTPSSFCVDCPDPGSKGPDFGSP